MSICVYARINKRCIDADLLEKIIINFFSPESNIIKQNSNEGVIYENISNKNEIIISFVSEKKAPYNVYDSSIINDDFKYIQLIIFDIKKEEASIDKYKEIINFCIYLKEKIEGDILITTDVHDEICLLKKQKIIWSQNSPIYYNKIM